MAGHMVEARLSDQAEAVVTQAALNIEADFSASMTAVNIASETIRGMIIRGADKDEVFDCLEEASVPLQGQFFGLELTRVYGYSDTLEGGSYLDSANEDARFVLPNAAETKLVVTMNARELLHFFELRCCFRAQWEIRDLAWKMLKEVKKAAPAIFENSGPACLRGTCPEGKMSCGRAAEMKNTAKELLEN